MFEETEMSDAKRKRIVELEKEMDAALLKYEEENPRPPQGILNNKWDAGWSATARPYVRKMYEIIRGSGRDN